MTLAPQYVIQLSESVTGIAFNRRQQCFDHLVVPVSVRLVVIRRAAQPQRFATAANAEPVFAYQIIDNAAFLCRR